jgi:hypothetical protein
MASVMSEITGYEPSEALCQVGKRLFGGGTHVGRIKRLFGGGTHLGRTQMMRDDEQDDEQAKLAARIGAHFDSLDAKLAKAIELTVAMKNGDSNNHQTVANGQEQVA